MSFHMPLPYGPAPSPDKPMAKAHPSFQGVQSLVISSGWRWGVENTDENRAGNNTIQANCSRPSSNYFVSEQSIIWLLDILFGFLFLWRFERHISDSEKGEGAVAAEGEWDHDAGCPGGGDAGMRWSLRNTHHVGEKRRDLHRSTIKNLLVYSCKKEIITLTITLIINKKCDHSKTCSSSFSEHSL